MVGSYGSVIFQVTSKKVLTPSKITRTLGATYATHTLIKNKPRKQLIGAKPEALTLDITLRADLGYKPRDMLETLRKMAENGVAANLIIGGRPASKLPLVILTISETWDTVLQGGELFQASVSLTLEEYK